MPDKYMDNPPHGLLITQVDGYPEGLLAVPNPYGSPRIIVPKSQVNALVLQCHEDIHHQSHIKVLHVLKALDYWPGMSAHAEKLCTACQTCLTASVRRKHLKTTFDAHAPQSTAMPRQDLWDRLLRRFQGRDHGNCRPIHQRNHPHPLRQQNARQCRINDTQKRYISTRSPTITQNGQRSRAIITHRSSVSNL